jgi:heterodisulfide reductase subunit C
MHFLQQILFWLVLAAAIFAIYKRVNMLKKLVQLGKPLAPVTNKTKALKTMFRVAFGQQKMFDRPVVGLLHFVVYAGFLLVNIEVLEIVLDGILGTHRLFSGSLGSFYPILIHFFEVVALLVLLVCVVFLYRRFVKKVPRLQAAKHTELLGFPIKDARIILCAEILLMCALLTMNAADSLLQSRQEAHYPVVGSFLVSQYLEPLFQNWSTTALAIYERLAWWLHIIGILAFALYVTYSKHLHIFLAFPNTYFAGQEPLGKMTNMPEVTQEVDLMLGLSTASSTDNTAIVGRFGAKDVADLNQKNLMDALSCTECGRCTASCPANITGKALSPRKIMMDTRDRLEAVGENMQANQGQWVDDGKSLYKDYIKAEELRACTSCNACVEACPILISPLDIILQLRRYQIMEESDAPASWNAMFANLENNQAPWKLPASERFDWAQNL